MAERCVIVGNVWDLGGALGGGRLGGGRLGAGLVAEQLCEGEARVTCVLVLPRPRVSVLPPVRELQPAQQLPARLAREQLRLEGHELLQ